MPYTFALISLGCPKNLISSEQMLCLLDEAGYQAVSDPEGADAVVVNTCGFIDEAKSEAIEVILEMAELKKTKKLKKIIVTGCLAERYQNELLSELPEVDAVLGVGSFGDIVSAVEGALGGETVCLFGAKNAPGDELPRIVTTGLGWASRRVAEGCSNRCAFCVIPSIRGRYRSRPMENIVSEARALAEAGVKELILVAQDVTRYGTDLYGARRLPALLRELAAIDGVEWLRLHYLYPDQFDDELIELIAAEPKIVKYLDVPIQHIHDGILRRMGRRGTGGDIRALFHKLRARIPGLVLRTSLITGLPGEGPEEFEELCEFLREAKIERAGVFPYSPEEGTPAAAMPDRCEADEARRRAELVRDLQAEVMDGWCQSRLGMTLRVLCEGCDDETGLLYGRSWADSPGIDGTVYFRGRCGPGKITEVKITETLDGDLMGVEA
jgi:ribosomal protein S12 methylthiotransferase